MGHGAVRLYFAVEKNGGWEDRAVIEMPAASLPDNCAFVVQAVRSIAAAEAEGPRHDIQHFPLAGSVN